MPCPLQLLKTSAVRQMANQMAYFDKAFATEDALRCGRLHTYLPGARAAGAPCRALKPWSHKTLMHQPYFGFRLQTIFRAPALPSCIAHGGGSLLHL